MLGWTWRTIWEIGRDGKTQWSLSDIDGPIESRVLSGNRILIAENSGNRVTERDRTGKILWKADIGDPALSAQRLPNGNTFIASNAAIREVARDGKEIYHRTLAEVGLGGDRFNAAHRLRDGRVMAIDATGTLVVLEVPAGKIVKLPAQSVWGRLQHRGGARRSLPGQRLQRRQGR